MTEVLEHNFSAVFCIFMMFVHSVLHYLKILNIGYFFFSPQTYVCAFCAEIWHEFIVYVINDCLYSS